MVHFDFSDEDFLQDWDVFLAEFDDWKGKVGAQPFNPANPREPYPYGFFLDRLQTNQEEFTERITHLYELLCTRLGRERMDEGDEDGGLDEDVVEVVGEDPSAKAGQPIEDPTGPPSVTKLESPPVFTGAKDRPSSPKGKEEEDDGEPEIVEEDEEKAELRRKLEDMKRKERERKKEEREKAKAKEERKKKREAKKKEEEKRAREIKAAQDEAIKKAKAAIEAPPEGLKKMDIQDAIIEEPIVDTTVALPEQPEPMNVAAPDADPDPEIREKVDKTMKDPKLAKADGTKERREAKQDDLKIRRQKRIDLARKTIVENLRDVPRLMEPKDDPMDEEERLDDLDAHFEHVVGLIEGYDKLSQEEERALVPYVKAIGQAVDEALESVGAPEADPELEAMEKRKEIDEKRKGMSDRSKKVHRIKLKLDRMRERRELQKSQAAEGTELETLHLDTVIEALEEKLRQAEQKKRAANAATLAEIGALEAEVRKASSKRRRRKEPAAKKK